MLSLLQTVTKSEPRLGSLAFATTRKDFQPKVELEFATGKWVARTVRDEAELQKVLELRKQVFHYEFARKRFYFGNDRDQYDDAGDLLAIYDTEAGQLIGTYRLISSLQGENFYSSTEYWIEGITSLPGVKLELSRACVHRDYRNGAILGLLWKAIAAYAKKVNAEYIFGLSSVSTINLHDVVAIYRYLQKEGSVDLGYNVIPREKYAIRDLPRVFAAQLKLPSFDISSVEELVPSLLKSYLRAGAKVCSHPVIDSEFKCADFLTILPMKSMSPAYQRRFMEG